MAHEKLCFTSELHDEEPIHIFTANNILFLWTLTSITTVVENSVLDTNVCNEQSRREIKGIAALYWCNQKYSSHFPMTLFLERHCLNVLENSNSF